MTYHYLRARLLLLDTQYAKVDKYLAYAFKHCHPSSPKNIRIILSYTVPVKLNLGLFPRVSMYVGLGGPTSSMLNPLSRPHPSTHTARYIGTTQPQRVHYTCRCAQRRQLQGLSGTARSVSGRLHQSRHLHHSRKVEAFRI